MAEIIPFHGILYNIDKIKNISDVVTPPYDVISEKEISGFYDRHPYNAIRLDKGRPRQTDTKEDNPHTRAGKYFKDWIKKGVLIRESAPALYLAAVEFPLGEKTITRYGLIARVKIEPFDKGIVLPHEKTFSKVKSERLELIKACQANFSQIFSVFADKSDVIGLLKNSVHNTQPVFDFIDDAGHRHKLWRIMDTDIQRQVIDGLKERKLFIADGHHRYETALNYKKWLQKTDPDFNESHPANYIMMYLCSIQDNGLVILPTNRLISTISVDLRNEFIKKAKPFFNIEKFPFDPSDLDDTQIKLRHELKADPGEHKIGVFIKEQRQFYILCLKPGVMDTIFKNEIKKPLRELDVIILTRLIFVKILGFDDNMLDNEKLINFTSKDVDAVTAITTGTHDMAFILNPTTNDQVRRIAEKGLIMPRKSTYYFPKAISGQVMNSLNTLPE